MAAQVDTERMKVVLGEDEKRGRRLFGLTHVAAGDQKHVSSSVAHFRVILGTWSFFESELTDPSIG